MLPDRWAAAHPDAILSHRLEESRARAAGESIAAPACNTHWTLIPQPNSTDRATAY
jgi:hypothetical protein